MSIVTERIALAALDLDGTLLRSDGAVSPREVDAVRATAEAGVEIVLATGRCRLTTAPIAEILGCPCALILQNGVWAARSVDAAHLFASELDGPTACDAIAFVRSLDFTPAVCQPVPQSHMVWYDRIDPWVREVFLFLRNSGRSVHVADVVEAASGGASVVMACGEERRVRRLIEAAADALPDLAVNASISPTDPNHWFAEFARAGTTKGRALARYAAMRGIPREAVLAVGDGPNDVDMLQWAGVGLAVADAPEAVRGCADGIVPDSDADGVAVALERWVLQPLERDSAVARDRM